MTTFWSFPVSPVSCRCQRQHLTTASAESPELKLGHAEGTTLSSHPVGKFLDFFPRKRRVDTTPRFFEFTVQVDSEPLLNNLQNQKRHGFWSTRIHILCAHHRRGNAKGGATFLLETYTNPPCAKEYISRVNKESARRRQPKKKGIKKTSSRLNFTQTGHLGFHFCFEIARPVQAPESSTWRQFFGGMGVLNTNWKKFA